MTPTEHILKAALEVIAARNVPKMEHVVWGEDSGCQCSQCLARSALAAYQALVDKGPGDAPPGR
jgi:hypothetical protein